MTPLSEPGSADGFTVEERAGIVWLEAPLVRSIFRFPLARDSGGEELDLGIRADTSTARAEQVILNRVRTGEALGLDPSATLAVRQVHGAEIADPSEDGESVSSFLSTELPGSPADGLLLYDGGVAVTVADCMAIGLEGEDGIALIHCGWRGLAGGILDRATEMVRPTKVVIGPAIGGCCYEVGADVAASLGTDLSPTGTVDLVGIATERLSELGVEAVASAGICTSCGPGEWFSHRRQGRAAGRHAAILSVEPFGPQDG